MTDMAAGQLWYIARDGKQTGPISDAEINAIAGLGYFRASDLVWRQGFPDWQPAFDHFPPAPTPASLPSANSSPPALPPLDEAPEPEPPAESPLDQANEVPATEPALAPTAKAQPSSPTTSIKAADPIASPTSPRIRPEPLALRPLPLQTKAAARLAAGGDPRDRDRTRDPGRLPQPIEPTARANPTKPVNDPADPTAVPRTKPRSSLAKPSPTADDQPTYPPARSAPVDQATPTNWRAIAALVVCAIAVTAGIWIAANPSASLGLPSFASLTASLNRAGAPQLADPFDQRLQQTAHWPVLKRVFPDWYGDRLREAAKLKLDQKSDDEIAKVLVGQMITLRRQNATQALAASGPKLRALAVAFLENLKQLKAQSTDTCYHFISRGEATADVASLLIAPDSKPQSLQFEMAAIFNAIEEGRATPVTHERPQKPDYDQLMNQLSKLGWTQGDVATFADPEKLAQAEPSRVCQMVQDWFIAHISIPDETVQERLLSETLRPVVAG